MSIDTLYALGEDALANQFEIVIPAFPGAIDVSSSIIRTTNITVPGYSVGTYKVDYKTQVMTKPSGKTAMENSFDFTFRIDKYWKVYEGFENWINLVQSSSTGAMSSDGILGTPSLIRINIDVIPLDPNGVITKKGWTMTGCFISALDGITFDHSKGEALEAKVTMQFVKKVPRT